MRHITKLWPIARAVGLALCCFTMLSAISGSVNAADCSIERYQHNHSVIAFSACKDGPVTLNYERPHATTANHGVPRDARLFAGREQNDGRLDGTMWVYKRGCGEMGFIVRGTRRPGRIVLVGRVPTRNGACEIIRSRSQEFIFVSSSDAIGEKLNASMNPNPRISSDGKSSRAAPSFSCTGRLNPAEAAICANPRLAQLDQQMVKAYKWRRSQLGAGTRKQLVVDQRNWLTRQRNRCGANASCLERVYVFRRAILEEWQPR